MHRTPLCQVAPSPPDGSSLPAYLYTKSPSPTHVPAVLNGCMKTWLPHIGSCPSFFANMILQNTLGTFLGTKAALAHWAPSRQIRIAVADKDGRPAQNQCIWEGVWAGRAGSAARIGLEVVGLELVF